MLTVMQYLNQGGLYQDLNVHVIGILFTQYTSEMLMFSRCITISYNAHPIYLPS